MAWEANCSVMYMHINHIEDRLKATIEEKEDSPEFEFGPVPTDFECNNGHVPHFKIPIGTGLFLPATFIH